MSENTKRPPSDRGQGRKPLKTGEESVVVTFRASKAQAEKFKLLGGGEWARERIDRAKLANVTKET